MDTENNKQAEQRRNNESDPEEHDRRSEWCGVALGDIDSKLGSHPLGHNASILERSASDKNVRTAEANTRVVFQ
jgi:hypothetical protein